jgi:ribosome-binding protein aMBF1 (putative translation factor)
MWCPRCGQLTGNTNQGHYWAYCKVTGTKRDFHMCCPDCCELEGIEPTKPFHPRYVELLETRKAEAQAKRDAMAEGQRRAKSFLDDISPDYEEKYPDMIASLRKQYGLE